jgi:hypothetical protein
MRGREHGGFRGEEEIGGEVGALLVVVAEGGVGFGDAYELDLGVRWEIVQEALYVAVDEADDGDSDRLGGLGRRLVRDEEQRGEEEAEGEKLRGQGGDHWMGTVCLYELRELI